MKVCKLPCTWYYGSVWLENDWFPLLFITCYKDVCLLHYFVIVGVNELWLFPILIFMQWMPELRRFAPNVPIVLVGTKLGMQLSSLSLPCWKRWLCITCYKLMTVRVLSFLNADLREDRGYLGDHMSSNTITSAQVCITFLIYKY